MCGIIGVISKTPTGQYEQNIVEKGLEEISEIVGLSPNNVKVKLFRIRKKLLNEMNSLMDNNINTVA